MTATTLHDQIRHTIINAITDGDLPPHSQIFSERELCDRYNVSRTTTRRAISDLVHAGILYTVSGKGTFVSEKPLRQELRLLVGFEEDLRSQGLDVSSRVLRCARLEANSHIAEALNLRPHAPVIELRRVRLSRNQPLAIQTSYLPEHLSPGLQKNDFTKRSLFRTLREDYGLMLVGGDTVIRAGLADEDEADLLQLSRPAPVLRTEQVTHLSTGEVIELCHASFPGEQFELGLSMKGGTPNVVNTVFSGHKDKTE